MSIATISKQMLLLMGLCYLCVMPLRAQDRVSDGYQEALRRIEEARANGATELNLSHLELQHLPPEIGQLINLQTLNLLHTDLMTLPPEIGLLTKLKSLDLLDNQLTMLPPEIGLLTNLEFLGLSQNQLTMLPPEIGLLTNLQILYLDSNRLTTLPVELAQLKQLIYLLLDGNPLTFPPYNIQMQGTQAILAYLRDYQAMQMRQFIAAITTGVGGIGVLILAFRWRQRRALGEKKKRM